MNVTNTKIVSTIEPTDDVEPLRARAEREYGRNWSSDKFYNRPVQLYSVVYEYGIPVALSQLQRNEDWPEGVWGLCRRYYSVRPDHTSTNATHGGKWGEPMFVDQYMRGKELGINKFMLSMARSSFVRVQEKRLARCDELTGDKWYTDYTRYLISKSPQYVMWNGQEDCYFEAET